MNLLPILIILLVIAVIMVVTLAMLASSARADAAVEKMRRLRAECERPPLFKGMDEDLEAAAELVKRWRDGGHE